MNLWRFSLIDFEDYYEFIPWEMSRGVASIIPVVKIDRHKIYDLLTLAPMHPTIKKYLFLFSYHEWIDCVKSPSNSNLRVILFMNVATYLKRNYLICQSPETVPLEVKGFGINLIPRKSFILTMISWPLMSSRSIFNFDEHRAAVEAEHSTVNP